MYIPRAWTKVTAEARFPDGRTKPVSVWGWGEDEFRAKAKGSERLQRVLERVLRGGPFPERYAYGKRPVREEILQSIDGKSKDEPSGLVTRNGYGAQVLNTAQLLFLDVDVGTPGLFRGIRDLLGGGSAHDRALSSLRDALQRYGRATFRIYRTARGLRAMAIDREFDAAADEAQALMRATGTDPSFAILCQVQRSFRARLTPKPWRCRVSAPPGKHPRQDAALRQRFQSWLLDYEKAASDYATCRYLETIGNSSPTRAARELIELHDRVTRCDTVLPLA